MVTERDLQILLAICRYYVLSRPQIQRMFFVGKNADRTTRARLGKLVDEHLLNRQHLLYCQPSGGSPATVYFPSPLGCELLASHFDDERFLAVSTQAPIPHHVNHWLAVSETHLALDAGIAAQSDARIVDWVNEYDVANKAESDPEKRYRLFTVIRESPRLVCTPDAGFLLEMHGHSKVFYLEEDRATSGARHVAETKTRGYAAMNEARLHRRHFPQATVDTFTVIMVAPHPKRRDLLRASIKGHPGDSLWKFTTVGDLRLGNEVYGCLLHAPIFYPCEGDPGPILKPKGS